MNNYQPSAQAASFLLFDVLKAPQLLAQLPSLAEHADTALMGQVLDEAAKFVGDVVAPLNAVGDAVGAQFQQGQVVMPPGFKQAYQAFWQAGWPALSSAPEHGGQGLPTVLEMVLYEWLSAANHGWTMAPGLLHGAYECIQHHASEELKNQYLEKVATGEWLATMCLTEPHAGSDLGLARTKAVAQADGSYHISGTKIFISGGEHDLTSNIVHLVLARLPDSAPGPKGLSLFLVPKFYKDGSRSAVVCERIEEKMGIHGSPTCVMRFDQATGWLVGEVGKGLNAMFLMMNSARLHVALQGVGLLDAAWQKATAYAHERRQMRAPGPRDKSQEADLIIQHPAIQRALNTQGAWVDAGRVLAYQTALELDVAKHHPVPERRLQANQWCALVTPVLKASWTHQAFHGGSDCLQVFGGHGYVREWGIEQNVRDARIAMIYEGTNEIQAQDLLFRKVLPDQGASLQALIAALEQDLAAQTDDQANVARQGFAQLREVLGCIARLHPSDADKLYPVAEDLLRAVTLVLMAWAWARLTAAGGSATHAQAFQRWVWPELGMRTAILKQELPSSAKS